MSVLKTKKTTQLTKCCVKCLDICKKSRQQTKCKHGRQGSQCKDCGGGHICEHSKQRSRCLFCGGSQICEHNKIKSGCKGCGGSQICEHNKRRSQCKDFGGIQICEHKKQTSICPTCDPLGHLAGVVRHRVYIALKNDKDMSSTEYLGCNVKTFKQHIEQQFTEDMSWENYVWYIDHKIPLKYHKPSLEEVAQRLNYTNTQPMWAIENMSKGCRYISR